MKMDLISRTSPALQAIKAQRAIPSALRQAAETSRRLEQAMGPAKEFQKQIDRRIGRTRKDNALDEAIKVSHHFKEIQGKSPTSITAQDRVSKELDAGRKFQDRIDQKIGASFKNDPLAEALQGKDRFKELDVAARKLHSFTRANASTTEAFENVQRISRQAERIQERWKGLGMDGKGEELQQILKATSRAKDPIFEQATVKDGLLDNLVERPRARSVQRKAPHVLTSDTEPFSDFGISKEDRTSFELPSREEFRQRLERLDHQHEMVLLGLQAIYDDLLPYLERIEERQKGGNQKTFKQKAIEYMVKRGLDRVFAEGVWEDIFPK